MATGGEGKVRADSCVWLRVGGSKSMKAFWEPDHTMASFTKA
jgi:hypothetical protein